MKKLITLALSLILMMTVTGASIHADDTLNTEGASSTADVNSTNTVNNNYDSGGDVFKVTVGWSIVPGTYSRTDNYVWDSNSLKYVADTDNASVVTKTDGTARITITNYSNTQVDYSIGYTSVKNNSNDITIEQPTTSGTDNPTGTIASASGSNSTHSAVYNGTIKHTAEYTASASGSSKMGTYTVRLSKHLTLSYNSMTVKTGRTSTQLTASTPVSWKCDDESVALVNASTGEITAVSNGTARITATSNYTGLSAISTITVQSSGMYFLNDCQDDFDLLLATDETEIIKFTDPESGNMCYAFNGFVEETQYATWSQAQSFVDALNTNGVVPVDDNMGTDGTWQILKNDTQAEAWARATNGNDMTTFSNYTTIFNGPYYLWTSDDNGNNGCNWNTSDGHIYDTNVKTLTNASTGFLVIWCPAN